MLAIIGRLSEDISVQLLSGRQFLALSITVGLVLALAAEIFWASRNTQTPPGPTNGPETTPPQASVANPVVVFTAKAASNPTTTPATTTPEPSPELSTSTPQATTAAVETLQPTDTAESPPNHIAMIRLEQAPGEFSAPEITADLRNLAIDGQRIRIIDEQGSEVFPIFYIQPRIWQAGDSISPVLEAQSREESLKYSNTAEFNSTDGTGHDSVVQRGDDSVIELHSWRARTPDGRSLFQPGELFKLILDGLDLMIRQNGQVYAVASRTAEERQHVIEQLIGQIFTLSQSDGKGGTVIQMVQIKWIYTASPPTVTEYYRDGAMTVRQMLEKDHGIISKQQSGEKWLQFCTMRTADQPRETYGRGGAGHQPLLIDHEQTLTNVSIIPVYE